MKYRTEFINHFLAHKDCYYTITDDETPKWKLPTSSPHRILICKQIFRIPLDIILLSFLSFFSVSVHDESTFRSGEVSPKWWFFQENKPFFSKGPGGSLMVSDILVQYPKNPFFELTEDEWKEAVGKYKSLIADSDVNYMSRTATATITIGSHAYFDNETILNQFERLFQMLEFKRE